MSFTATTKHVNSKILLTEIREFVDSTLEDFGVLWSSESQREALVEVLDEFLIDMCVNQNTIEQWDVICDDRNNIPSAMRKGRYFLTIKYRQKNCFNITEINYQISTQGMPTDLNFEYIV